ncbi:thioredoxin family protein [Nocardioides sp.]|uniref:TlpA family protein disulfide reductase n=1 Tax=Nocardioides sp. TaxID=35761 RepID=UPI001A30D84C|nr:thioredoxin family protein [Nocardioides sp.]MBJ7357276.1 thioredoxin family protein [Nocardioides sp.]
MSTGAWIVIIAVVVALGFGLYRAAVDGRFRGTHRLRAASPEPPATPVSESLLADTEWAGKLGERATLLQFSSAFCAPCRTTRHVLADVAARADGVTHIEVDAEHHLDLVRRLGILRTPTTLILDRTGREHTRASGAPRRNQVEAALSAL